MHFKHGKKFNGKLIVSSVTLGSKSRNKAQLIAVKHSEGNISITDIDRQYHKLSKSTKCAVPFILLLNIETFIF